MALDPLPVGLSRAKLRILEGLVEDAVDNEWDQAKLQREVAKIIGLSDRDAQAVKNRRAKLRADGVAPGKAQKEVDKYIKTLTQTRAATIANTERMIVEQGDLVSAAEPGTKKKWVTHKDERLCPVCRPLHGTVQPLTHKYPGGKLHPPLHPNCRCTLKIVK